MNRPDHVICIAHSSNHKELLGKTLCGLPVVAFCFLNIDHAFYNSYNHGYLLICPDCSVKAIEILKSGTF